MTIAVESMVPEYVWTANNALAFTPRGMSPAAYPVLLHLLGRQEPGGRCVATQDVIAQHVGLSRSKVTRGLQHLGFALMVWKEGNGLYRLSPLIAGFRTPAEQLAAIGAMDDDDRFDHPDFQERYERRVAQYEKERQEKAARRQRPAEPPIDLASRRRH
ncbi:helix-turn-helix domain-containing protein [Streptomyces lavendulae]|uniref:helix-turn-helix domain-containing protein n=1 Tax=Streptomyces lavendulae TaxID=1914 RepID=UPI0034078C95